MGSTRRWLTAFVCLVLGGGLVAAVAGMAGGGGVPHGAGAGGPAAGDFVDIRDVPADAAGRPGRPGPDASTGSFAVDCGRNEEAHYNEDNLVVSPGLYGGAHHTHAYVGNLSTDARSTDRSLAAAATTCRGGDRSTYYWPVLRRPDRPATLPYEKAAGHGNTGEILRPVEVRLEFRGNPAGKVVPMPRFLRAVTGDAVAFTARSDAGVRARWGCAGRPDRSTTRYPRCPAGDRLTRTLVFPSCWNGLDTATPARTHLLFPGAGGVCPGDTFAVPELRITLAYPAPPADAPIALDSFPEQRHSPKTDHAMFVNVMTDARMAAVVACINSGRRCA
ncbi:DUF1996 domain-containing protein [Streptomyces showdoensis]|uniref:DUF1996 domain-containing protein n=1 Tax=Streptomyces showdoensis TaxID=68268 RepID=A0A2P2GNU1_STREW|nr:DUF1996 domain-containing protein [Streptomyces showdoensis]KKZ73168.1 hypothetical protein VO63_14340 [Streptomyces showdoensis]